MVVTRTKAMKQKREQHYQNYRRNKPIANLLKWKKSRAEHKHLVKESKKKDWIDFVSKIRKDTKRSTIYEYIRHIKGKSQRKVTILHEKGQYFTTIPELATKIAETLAEISSNNHYSPEFQAVKRIAEKQKIDFSSTNKETYNSPFTIQELQTQLGRTNDTAPGPDGMHYKMIKMLPDCALEYLIKVINRHWM